MKTLTVSVLLGCALAAACLSAACDRPNDASTTTTTSGNTSGNTSVNAGSTPGADNTCLNMRDKSSGTVTPIDQGNNQADLETTQAIRKSLMADDSLSTDAKNVKVITTNGSITLRGPVKSALEKQNVETRAKANAGTNQVVDQLDIETKQ